MLCCCQIIQRVTFVKLLKSLNKIQFLHNALEQKVYNGTEKWS